jgi:hypothetical protein
MGPLGTNGERGATPRIGQLMSMLAERFMMH